MRKFILAGLAALPLLIPSPAPLQAAGCCGGGCHSSPTLNFGFGMRIGFHHWAFCEKPQINPCLPGRPHGHKHKHCGSSCPTGPYAGDGGATCTYGAGAPWYLYWPMNAHFQMPAPTGYPYWPAPQTIQPGFNPGAYHGYNMPVDANAVQPVGYQPGYYPQAPAYWYGR